MATATADPSEDPGEAKRRPGPAQPPVPQPQPKPAPKPPARPPSGTLTTVFEDDPPPPAPAAAPAAPDERLRAVGQRLQLLVEASGEHLGEARAIAGVLRPDGAAYGRMEGLMQALEYDREALLRAIEHLRQVAQALAAEETARVSVVDRLDQADRAGGA